MKGHDCLVTTRRFGNLERLLEQRRLSYRVIGGHQGSSPFAKALGTGARTLQLAEYLPRFDASIASLGVPSVLAARLRGRPAIGFLDGDIPTSNLRLSAPFVSRLFVPEAYQQRILDRFGLAHRTVRYVGFKEQIAAATFDPDPGFLGRLPFSEYVLLRAEALQAEYVPRGSLTLVPQLLRRFEEEGVHVLFLPRYPEDRAYAAGRQNVYMPDGPINGLDACYHARAVLTGSGTLAREAAVLGVPAASFFPGATLLSVDRAMIERSWAIHSTDPGELVRYALSAERRGFDRARCSDVLKAVLAALESVLRELAS